MKGCSWAAEQLLGVQNVEGFGQILARNPGEMLPASAGNIELARPRLWIGV